MLKIYNSDTVQESVKAGRLQGTGITFLDEKAIPVIELNPRLLRVVNLCKSSSQTNPTATSSYGGIEVNLSKPPGIKPLNGLIETGIFFAFSRNSKLYTLYNKPFSTPKVFYNPGSASFKCSYLIRFFLCDLHFKLGFVLNTLVFERA